MKKKYMMSGGLAFAEEKDMEKLRQHSLKGWHVSDFKLMGYILKKGEKKDYIYSIDYRDLNEADADEYFDFFSSAGWTHITSEAGIHLFRAYPGTKPIYSDQDTSLEKYHHLNTSVNKLAIPLVLVNLVLWIGAFFSSGMLQTILTAFALILTIFALPAGWTTVAAYSNNWKVKGKRRRARLLKNVPMLLLTLVVIVLLFMFVPDRAIQIIISGLIGGVVLPFVLWLVLSLYYKVTEK